MIYQDSTTSPLDRVFRGKKVLVTGDTGFKGSWLSLWLDHLGAEVFGLGLDPSSAPSLFQILKLADRITHTTCDVGDLTELESVVRGIRPDFVFHLAAQSLVREAYRRPLETLHTNFMGTAHLLHALTAVGYTADAPCRVVVVTSDKCYENWETSRDYREEDPMGGHDLYSCSKGAVELLVSSWRRSFFQIPTSDGPAIFVATCRAGNALGGGDWSADRIVPDCIRALEDQRPISIRNPDSVRPWQHVLEPLSGYLRVASLLGTGGTSFDPCTAWNFGPGEDSHRRVRDLVELLIQHWGGGAWNHEQEQQAVHEARSLHLSIEKARRYLGWQPVWNFEQTVRYTVDWYRTAHECGYDSHTLMEKSLSQIKQYLEDAAA